MIATFEKFRQGAVKDHRVKFRSYADMNHVEAGVLERVAKLYPDLFSALDRFFARHRDYVDETIATFDREVQFYAAYLEHVERLQAAGLTFCYPCVSEASKEVLGRDAFDVALADKLVREGSPVVCNDFHLDDRERIFVVSGPNQGGKRRAPPERGSSARRMDESPLERRRPPDTVGVHERVPRNRTTAHRKSDHMTTFGTSSPRHARTLGFASFVVVLLALLGSAPAAQAAVSVTRAELSGSQVRVEGRGAQAGSLVRVVSDLSSASRNADSSGNFRVEASSFRSSNCRVTVSDPVSSATATLSGCTATSPPPSAFAIDDRPLPDGNVGTDYNNFVTATGGNGTPYRWSIAAGALPDGLAIRDFASASGHIFGRPTTVQSSTFTVRATDQAGNSTTRQFTITINPPRPLVITSPSQLPAGTRGQAYAVGVFADGGATPYSWTQTGGTLPPGLSLQASPGRIQGTPTTAGTFNFTLRVADSGGQSTSGAFSITVNEPVPPPTPPGAPTLVSPADGASVITPFSISWAAPPGPVSAYNWSVSTSPDFATTALVGSTAGTVTEATVTNIANGTYFWRVQAANGATVGPFSATRSFTITGTTSPPTLTGVGVNPQTVSGGNSAIGTVFVSLPAPAGGTTVALSNNAPTVASVPASVTVPTGATQANFTVTTQPVTSSWTAVITATLGSESRSAFLSVVPSAPPPTTDSVSIQRTEYDASKRTLSVEATSTSASATMRVFSTATGAQIGTLANQGGGRYRATFNNIAANPQKITVRSSLGGSASRNVTVK